MKKDHDMEEIYRRHARHVYGFLLSRTNSPDLAEELTQETFYQAVKNIDRFEGKSEVSTWLCGIAKNVWRTYLKKHPEETELTEFHADGRNAEERLEVDWDCMQVLKLLHRLDEPMREVLYLRLTANLSFREIGEIMERSEVWARVNFYRGKEKIMMEVKKNEA